VGVVECAGDSRRWSDRPGCAGLVVAARVCKRPLPTCGHRIGIRSSWCGGAGCAKSGPDPRCAVRWTLFPGAIRLVAHARADSADFRRRLLRPDDPATCGSRISGGGGATAHWLRAEHGHDGYPGTRTAATRARGGARARTRASRSCARRGNGSYAGVCRGAAGCERCADRSLGHAPEPQRRTGGHLRQCRRGGAGSEPPAWRNSARNSGP
jgi:hypothetical protein